MNGTVNPSSDTNSIEPKITTDEVKLQIPETLWLEFQPHIQSGIIAEYKKLPETSNKANSKDNVYWMKAFMNYVGITERVIPPRPSWIGENITGLMLISALLALAFGCLGAYGLVSADNKLAGTANGFLDIAKLFAGTLVGAAGATAIAKR